MSLEKWQLDFVEDLRMTGGGWHLMSHPVKGAMRQEVSGDFFCPLTSVLKHKHGVARSISQVINYKDDPLGLDLSQRSIIADAADNYSPYKAFRVNAEFRSAMLQAVGLCPTPAASVGGADAERT